MAVDLISLGYRIDTAPIKTANTELDKLSRNTKTASGEANQFTKSNDNASKSVSGLAGSIRTLAGAYIGLAGASKLVQVADQYTKLNAQLRIASRNQGDFNQSFSDVVRISNTAQSGIAGTATLYARLANTLKDTNVTQQQFSQITESVALGLRVSGATAAEANSAMLQLSQAFAAGVLRGEEFNAVSEASFPLMKALADSMGIPIEQLRSMAMEGKITRDELVKAFADPALIASFKEQAKEMNTVSGAMQVMFNQATLMVGKFDETTGSSKALAEAINVLSQNLDVVLSVLGGIAAYFATKAIITGFTLLAGAVATVSAPVLLLAGAVTALTAAFLYFRNTAGESLDDLTKREIELEKRIAFSKVTMANRGQVPYLQKQLKEVKDLIAKEKELNKVKTGTEQPYTGALSPNFTSTVEVQNIDEIHRKQDEANKKAQQAYQDRIKAIEDADKAEFELYQKKFAMQEEWQGLETKFYNLLEKTRAEDEKKAFEDAKKRIEMLQDIANRNFKEAQDAQKELDRENDRISKDFSRSLTDALFRGFEAGKSFAQNFRDTLINSFRTLVLQPVVQFLVDSSGLTQVLSSLTGSLTGQGNGLVAQNGGGIGGLLGNIKGIFTNTNASIISGIEGIGASIANGLGGIRDSIGGFIGANAGIIANLSSFSGAALSLLQGDIKGAAFQGAGAGIGLALGGPIGGAIGSFLGSTLGGLFGGKDIPLTGDQAKTSFDAGKLTTTSGVFGKSSIGGQDTLKQLTETFANSYGSLLTAFDEDAKFRVAAIYRSRTNERGFLYATDDSGIGQAVYGNKNGGLQGFIKGALGEGLAKAIQNSGAIPQSFKDLFKGLKKPEAVEALINDVVRLQKGSLELSQSFDVTAEQVALMAKESGIAGENFTKLTNVLLSASAEALTVGDAILNIKAGLTEVFGSALPNTLAEYDNALKAINTTTVEGRAEFLKLLDTRGAFSQFNSLITGLQENVRSGLFSIVSDSEKMAMQQAELAKLFGELGLAVPTSVQELINLGKSIDYTTKEGLNLASVFPQLVNAFTATQGAVDSLIDSLREGSKFASSFEFNRYRGVAQNFGSSFANNYVDSLPSYSVGTDYVPNTGLAMLHQGERVVTASDNASLAQTSAQQTSEMKGMRAMLQSIALSSMKLERNVDRLVKDGFLFRNVDANGDTQIIPVTVV